MTPFDPLQYKNIERQVYSMTAPDYDKYGSATFESCAQPLLQHARLVPGQVVLDVACGPGIPSLMAAPMVAPGGTVTGVDLAPGMVALARSKAQAKAFANVDFREGDAEALPFPDDSFDVVLYAGFQQIQAFRHNVVFEVKSASEYWKGVVGISGRLQMLLKNIPEETAARIRNTVMETVERFRTGDNKIVIPCEEVVGMARK
ncbi:MAG TPA: class I SAM-dependent methyltransferase [Syntrophorhabdaceae bacterium]